jgi:uncharacterized HAD superfamily protein
MKPIIAIDCDGVLTDNRPVWKAHFAEHRCGKPHADEPSTTDWNCWRNLCRKCWDDVLHLPEILTAHRLRPDVRESLARLSAHARLTLITSRPLSVESTTNEWLEEKDIRRYFHSVILADDKRTVCDQIRALALIDDAPHNLIALNGSRTIPVIYDSAYNQHLFAAGNLPALRVSSWKQAYTALMYIVAAASPDLSKELILEQVPVTAGSTR